MGNDVLFRPVSADEFKAIKGFKACLDRADDPDPMLTLPLFNKAWQWLGRVFHSLIRIRHAWSMTSPRLVYILSKVVGVLWHAFQTTRSCCLAVDHRVYC
jgi:hypothetical protein